MVERLWRARFEPLYFLVEDDGELRAAAVAYLVEPSPAVETLDDLLLGRLRPAAARFGLGFLPALVCGPAQGYGWHIGTDTRLGAADRDRLRRLVLGALETEADRRRLSLAFPQVLDEQRELRALLAERGYLSSRNVPVAALDVRWRSLEEYFKSLPAKRRREFRRERRRNEAAGASIEPIDLDRDPAERLQDLLERNARRHGSPGWPFGPELFAELCAGLGEGAQTLVARKAGDLSGACVVLEQGGAATAYAVGVDPALGGDDFTYFNLCYYTLIERAIERGLERIYFGRGMYRVKLRRGCRLIGASVYLRTGPWRAALCRPWLALASAWNRRKLSAATKPGLESRESA